MSDFSPWLLGRQANRVGKAEMGLSMWKLLLSKLMRIKGILGMCSSLAMIGKANSAG